MHSSSYFVPTPKSEIKETLGELSNNPDLEAEGIIEKTKGQAQEKVGQIKKVFGK